MSRKKTMGSALSSSIKAEEKSVQQRFEQAEKSLTTQEPESKQEEKVEQPKKVKTIRDSFTIPEFDHVKIAELQQRLLILNRVANKSEILRAGLHALEKLSDNNFIDIIEGLEKVKTGRPKQ